MRAVLQNVNHVLGGPKKVSHYQIIKKLRKIVLKSANEIRFFRQIKEMIRHYNIIRLYYVSFRFNMASVDIKKNFENK